MTFSIVIPLYNKEKYIGNTLKSILSQTFGDYEIIIVNDCSTDKSRAEAVKFESPKIRIIDHEKNKGLSASRNTGIRNASSSFIAFVDADDTWKSFFLEKMSEMISHFPEAGLFASGYEESYTSKALEIHKNVRFADGEMNIIPDFYTACLNQPIFCYSSIVVKKEVFESAGYFDENITFGEDVDFNIRANMKFQLAYYNRIAATYTIFSENQITNSKIEYKAIPNFDKYENYANEKPSVEIPRY